MLFAIFGLLSMALLPATSGGEQGPQVDGQPFIIAGPIGEFNATGVISSVISNETAGERDILAGSWVLLVSETNVTGFVANFTAISVDGTDRHVHSISRFEPNAISPVILDVHGTTFTGLTDITTDGNAMWSRVQTTVTIARQDVIRIVFDRDDTDGHFGGEPIYGIVYSIQRYDPQ